MFVCNISGLSSAVSERWALELIVGSIHAESDTRATM